MATPKVLLKRSSVAGRVPAAGDLQYGELAINFEDGKIYYKDASNNIKAFVDSGRVQAIADAVETVAQAQLDSGEVTSLIDSAYVNARLDLSTILDSAEIQAFIDSDYIRGKIDASFINDLTGVDADTLGGQPANYYNDWNNVTNKPNILDSQDVVDIAGSGNIDSAGVIALIDSAYVDSRVDSVGTATNAKLFNNQAPSYYLNFNNLTNPPTIIDLTDVSNQIVSDVDSAYVQARSAAGADGQVLFNNSGVLAGDSAMMFNPGTDRLTVTNLTATTNLSLGGSGSQFFAFNEDTVKVKFANWYSSNDRQYGQGQLWYELFFVAADSSDTYDDRRIGFYLEKPNAGASDAVGSATEHPTNARMYIATDKVYIESDLEVSGDITADNLKIVDSAGVTSVIDSAYVAARSGGAATQSMIDSSIPATVDSDYVRLRVKTNQNLSTTDNVQFNDITVAGDLTVQGTTTEVNTIVYTTNDPLLHLADSNEQSDVVDIGFLGHYFRNGRRRHTGFFRDASDEQYYIFDNLIDSAFDSSLPPNIVNRSGLDFRLAHLNVNKITGKYTGIDSDFTAKSTSDLSEGTNLYYTDARAESAAQAVIDSAYISARASSFDSNNALGLIDSAYITARASTFDSGNATGLIDSAYVQARQTAGTDSSATVAIIDSHIDKAFVDALGVDAATLGGRDSSYLLNYNNFTNTPTIPVQNKANIDALGVDADTLDNQDGSYYLAYANFTGTPDILDSGQIKEIFNSVGDNQLETERVVGLEYLEFVHDSDVTTFLVEVASKTAAHRYEGTGSSQGYVIRNQESPFMQFVPGNKYRFDQSNGTNVSHQIRFYYDAAKTTEYTTNVTFVGTAGSAGAYTEIEITDDTPPVLHYQCINHGYMGNAIFVQTRNFTGFTTDDLTEGTSNLYHTTARVESIVDSAYVQARVNLRDSGFVTGLIDSAYIANIVDSAYIKLREQDSDALAADGSGGGIDSAATISLIQATVDSDYVAAREALSGGGAANAFKNIVVSGQDSIVADNATDTLKFEAGSNITLTTDASTDTITIASTGGGGGVGDGVTITKFVFTADSAQTVFADSDDNGDTLTYDAGDTQINVFLNGILQVDSDDFTMTDSNTVTLTSGANLGDILQVIKYTPPSGGGGSGTVDSAQTINLIEATVDSDYVIARGIFDRGTLEVNKFFFDADSGQTVFSGTDKFSKTFKVDASNTEVYLNGILQELTTDYTIDSATVTFTEAVDSGYSVSIIETVGRVDTVSSLHNSIFEFDADSGQTVFTGNDRDGVALDIAHGVTDVYLNGILLSPENDYQLADDTVTLLDSADSGDFLAIINRKGVMTSSLNTKQYYFTGVVGFTISGNGLAYTGNIQVFKNGDPLVQGTDFTAKDGTTISLTDNAIASDTFVIHTFNGNRLTANSYDFIADSGQTSFRGEDRHGQTMTHVAGTSLVYLNGIALIESADYTVLNSRTVNLITAANANDELKVVSYDPVDVSSIAQPLEFKNFEYTATASQSVFTDSDDNGEVLAYTSGKVNVYLNGLMLKSSDFTANNDSSVSLTVAADSGDVLVVQKLEGNNIGLDSIGATTLITNTIDSSYIAARQSNAATWEEQTDSSVTLSANSKNIIDCSSSAVNATLPGTPSLGDEIRVIDGTGNASTNNITLLRNGNNIQGADSDFIIDVDRAGIGLVYYNATQGWILIEN